MWRLRLPRPRRWATGQGKLLLTGGVSQVEGAAGGNLTPWATISGYGTNDQIGRPAITPMSIPTTSRWNRMARCCRSAIASSSRSRSRASACRISARRWASAQDFKIDVTTYGAKVRLFGDAILDQDNWIPQVSVRRADKDNEQDALVQSLGADGDGTDFYVSATSSISARACC